MRGIYKISSLVKPDRIYIGSAVTCPKRFMEHRYSLRKNNHHSKKLQRHFNKYGESDLIFSIVEEVLESSNLIKREQFYIDTFSPYFNSRPIANSNFGLKFGPQSKERKENISAIMKARKNTWTADALSKRINKYSLSGELIASYKNTREAKRIEGVEIRRFTNINKTIGGFVWVVSGTDLPDFTEIKKSLSNAKMVNNKRVFQISKKGELIKEFAGIRIASRETGIDHRSIQSVAANSNPNRKTAGGYAWKYV